MKKVSVILSAGFLLLVLITACQPSKDKAGQTEADKMESATPGQDSTKVAYTCSMHPEVTSDKPGKCPKCDMELAKKE